ncbi:hypothetical protein [Nitratireductor basaltis]|uniref:Uncharacterized protein n=1 Tax=Nitratireductor basaltis TaxID=472175 RepID=A0A084UBM6_9HYPH|nr:hypothetical protein [Nitratireductor basaltis]KFB10362.1 hypothetical protein EL18_01393 [Nitratireductor basaltis]
MTLHDMNTNSRELLPTADRAAGAPVSRVPAATSTRTTRTNKVRSGAKTNKHQVIAYLQAHEGATAQDVAKALGTSVEYVRATATRNGLKLGRARSQNVTLKISESAFFALEEAAAKREITSLQLARQILQTVATENLVDAVLDDGRA